VLFFRARDSGVFDGPIQALADACLSAARWRPRSAASPSGL